MEKKKVLNQHNMEQYKDFVEKGINESQEEFLFFPAQIMSEAFRQDYPTGRILVDVNTDIGGSSGRYIGYGKVYLSMEDEHPVIEMPVRRSHGVDDTFDTFDTAVSAVTSKMLRFIGYDVPLSMRLEMLEKIRQEEAEKDAIIDEKIAEDNKKRQEAEKQTVIEEPVVEETTEEVVEEQKVEEPVVEKVEEVVEEPVVEEVSETEEVEEAEEVEEVVEEPEVEEVEETEEAVEEAEETVEEPEVAETEEVEEVEEVQEEEKVEQASLDLEVEESEEDSDKPNLTNLMSLEDALNLTPEYDLLSSRTMREWVKLIEDPAAFNVTKVDATNTFGLINFLAEKFEHGDNPIARELPKESEAAYVIVANGLIERAK